MTFRLDTPYYQIPGSQPEATFGAIMEMLLKTRLKLHLETNRQVYDEDVNTYLAALLVSYIDPRYLASIAELLNRYDLDLYQAVEKSQDRAQAYRIYKVNADDLLVSLGMFRPLWQEERGKLDRMKRYYSSASHYQRRIYGKSTAVGEIQAKLAQGPERYLAILAGTSHDYFHFLECVHPQEMLHLVERFKEFERQLPIKKLQDELLDAFSTWLKEPRELALKERVERLAEELKRLDPTFETEPLLSRLKEPS